MYCNCEISMVSWTIWSMVTCQLSRWRHHWDHSYRCAYHLSLRCGNRWCRRATSSYGNVVSDDTKLTESTGLITAYGDVSESQRVVLMESDGQHSTQSLKTVSEAASTESENCSRWSSSAGNTWRNTCVNTVPGHQSTSGMRTWYVVQSSSSSLDLSLFSEFVPAPRLDSSTAALIPFFNSWSNLALPFFSRSIIFFRFLDIFLLWREFRSSWLTRIHQLPSHLCHSSPSSSYLHGMPLFHVLGYTAAAVIQSYISILFVLRALILLYPTYLRCILVCCE